MNILGAIGVWNNEPRFKSLFTPQQRKKKQLNIQQNNPNHIAVVIEPRLKAEVRNKKTYLVLGLERDCLIAELTANLRNILGFQEKQSVFLHTGKTMFSGHQQIKNLEKYIESDGFLYLFLEDQEAFG